MNEIKSKDNNLVKNIVKLSKSSKQRKSQQLFLAEGLRLCEDALLSKSNIVKFVYTKNAYDKHYKIVNELIKYAKESFMVSENIFSSFSDTKSPQGVLCVIKPLDKVILFDKIIDNGKFLALDNIQDPTNLGTILRSADAIGIDGIVLSKDCCDIYSPKVVRGSMGAIFRLPCIIVDNLEYFLQENKHFTSFASVVDKDASSVTEVSFPDLSIVVVGNEGNGISENVKSCCDKKITIPMLGNAESLNAAVAASILMWEMIK